MRIKKWLASVLGLPKGVHITVPEGAVLIMPPEVSVDTLNVVGGTVIGTQSIEETMKIIESHKVMPVPWSEGRG